MRRCTILAVLPKAESKAGCHVLIGRGLGAVSRLRSSMTCISLSLAAGVAARVICDVLRFRFDFLKQLCGLPLMILLAQILQHRRLWAAETGFHMIFCKI